MVKVLSAQLKNTKGLRTTNVDRRMRRRSTGMILLRRWGQGKGNDGNSSAGTVQRESFVLYLEDMVVTHCV